MTLLRGQLVKLSRRPFKIGIVVEVSPPRALGKVRICVWSQNSATWSQPQLVRAGSVEPCPEWPDPDPSGKRRRAVIDALAGVKGCLVTYLGGSHYVGTPFAQSREQATPPVPMPMTDELVAGQRVLVSGYGPAARRGWITDLSMARTRIWISLDPAAGSKRADRISLTTTEARRLVTIDRSQQ